MAPFYSLFYLLLGVIVWTLPWVAFHGGLALVFPDAYAEHGTPTDTRVLAAGLALAAALSLFAGFLIARLVHARPRLHATLLGALQLALSASIATQNWSSLPQAYHVALLGMLLPLHAAGGALGSRKRRAPTS